MGEVFVSRNLFQSIGMGKVYVPRKLFQSIGMGKVYVPRKLFQSIVMGKVYVLTKIVQPHHSQTIYPKYCFLSLCLFSLWKFVIRFLSCWVFFYHFCILLICTLKFIDILKVQVILITCNLIKPILQAKPEAPRSL